MLCAVPPCHDVIAGTIQGVRIGKSGFAYRVDKGGLMLAHSDYSLVQAFDINSEAWGKQVLSRSTGILRYTADTGVERLINFRLASESSDWIAETSELTESSASVRNISLITMLGGALRA